MKLARSTNGRFAKGNQGGPGNPYSKKTAHIKRVLLDAVTDRDLRAIVKSLVEAAKAGNAKAAELLLDRLIGKPTVEPLAGAADVELTTEEQAAVAAEMKSSSVKARRENLRLKILKPGKRSNERIDGSDSSGASGPA